MGLATGFWAIFWAIPCEGSDGELVPEHNQSFWVFFRVSGGRAVGE